MTHFLFQLVQQPGPTARFPKYIIKTFPANGGVLLDFDLTDKHAKNVHVSVFFKNSSTRVAGSLQVCTLRWFEHFYNGHRVRGTLLEMKWEQHT